MSCGAILFSFGAPGKRYMDPDATLMIHDVSSMSWGKVEEVKVSAEETDRLNQKIYHMMAENCGQAEDYFLEIVKLVLFGQSIIIPLRFLLLLFPSL